LANAFQLPVGNLALVRVFWAHGALSFADLGWNAYFFTLAARGLVHTSEFTVLASILVRQIRAI
jgi:hypothetical protein